MCDQRKFTFPFSIIDPADIVVRINDEPISAAGYEVTNWGPGGGVVEIRRPLPSEGRVTISRSIDGGCPYCIFEV